MTPQVAPWLPANSFTPEAIETALVGAIGGWATEWLGDADALTPIFRSSAGRPLSSQGQIDVSHASVELSLPGRGKRGLLELALKKPLQAIELSLGDHALLDDFSRKMSDDLCRHIARYFEADRFRDLSDKRIMVAICGRDRADIWQMSLPRVLLVGAIKRRSFATGFKPSIGQRRDALAAKRVVLDAVLGGVAVTVRDVEELAIGDVLVLDRELNAGVELRLRPAQRLVATGALEKRDGHVAVRLEAAGNRLMQGISER